MGQDTISVVVEFTWVHSFALIMPCVKLQSSRFTDSSSGGLEMLFGNETKHTISIPAQTPEDCPSNVAFLINYLCDHVMKDSRRELFVLNGSM